MELKLLTNYSKFVENISSNDLADCFGHEDECHIESTNLSRIPGASGGWFELAINFGVIAIPSSIFSGIVAAWLWSIVDKTKSIENKKIKIVLKNEGRTAEIEIDQADRKATEKALKAALKHVDKSK